MYPIVIQMTLQQISMRLNSDLLSKLDSIAKEDFKRRSDVIRDALVDYVKEQIEIREIKEMATKKFLDGDLGFDDLARIVGFRTASQIMTANDVLMESIEGAKSDSKQG